MHRVTQNSVGGGQVLVLSIQGNSVPACILLRKNFWNGVPVRSVTKIALIITLNPLNYTHSHNNTLQAEEKQKKIHFMLYCFRNYHFLKIYLFLLSCLKLRNKTLNVEWPKIKFMLSISVLIQAVTLI
jgi:hypothetical protein